MLNFAGTCFLLGADSAFASAAIGMILPKGRLRWQLPAAFAICDGLFSFLGCVTRPGLAIDRSVAEGITLLAAIVAMGLLLVLAASSKHTHSTRTGKTVILVAIPLLLAVDNYFGGEASSAIIPPATLALATAGTSYLTSLLGLFIGEWTGARLQRFGWSATAPVALLLMAMIAS